MKHIDKLFKEKLYNHEAVVPEGMWEKIAPVAEEESGRAILWFWLAGLIALFLGGYGIYNLISKTSQDKNVPGTLVHQQHQDMADDSMADKNVLAESMAQNTTLSNIEKEEEVSETGISENIPQVPDQKKRSLKKPVQSKTKVDQTNQANEDFDSQSISNTVENITNTIGIPANLVITKSYINREGYVIKQSNLTQDSGNEDPVFDVIINSEVKDLNAGTLLRIIEPLEFIPLPAFQKKLKKKTLTISI